MKNFFGTFNGIILSLLWVFFSFSLWAQEVACLPVKLESRQICGLDITQTDRACQQLKREISQRSCPAHPGQGQPQCCSLLTEMIECDATMDSDLFWCVFAYKNCSYGCNNPE